MKQSMFSDWNTPYGVVYTEWNREYIPRLEYSVLSRVCIQITFHMKQNMYQDLNVTYGVEYVPRSDYSKQCKVYTLIRMVHMEQSMFPDQCTPYEKIM